MCCNKTVSVTTANLIESPHILLFTIISQLLFSQQSGLAGTATAFSLSEKGIKSTLLEQSASLAPATASSNGDSRMYRKMYSSEFFSKMQAQALERWADVEEKTGQSLLQENGLLF